MNRISVLHINTNDGDDGVGRAATRLHRALNKNGVESRMFVQRRASADQRVTKYQYPRGGIPRLRRWVYNLRLKREFSISARRRPAGYERFSDDRSTHKTSVLKQMPQADILHLHSIADFIDYQSFFQNLPPRVPLVWTLHDMEPFTGGCHYAFDCRGFASGCGTCPQLGSDNPKDLSRQIWQRKQRVFSQLPAERLHIVALNHWMAEQVAQSPMLSRFPATIIPNGLDLWEFAPRPRDFARETLGIPQKVRALLYVAGSMKTRRKGFHLLAQALTSLQGEEDLFLLSLGGGHPEFKVDIPHKHLGSVHNDRLISLIYSAADVFVLPSLLDNLPNTALEAFACGTPVAAFRVGGIPDIVRDGENGFMAAPEDPVSLADAILKTLQAVSEDNTLRQRCRRFAEKHYSLDRLARDYLNLYQKIMNPTQS